MTPEDMLQSYRSQIAEKGIAISIRRYTGQGTLAVPNDYPTQGFPRNFDASELVGSIQQGDQTVVILVDSLDAVLPVTNRDKVLIGSKELAIKNVKNRRVGSTLIALELQVAG